MANYPDKSKGSITDKAGAASARRILESGEIINVADLLATSFGFYGGIITEPRTPVIELSNALPLSDLRDDQFTRGSSTIVDDSPRGTYRLRHTTGGDAARLQSQRRGRYQPGAGAFTGVAMYGEGSITDATAKAEWGYFETTAGAVTVENGFLFGMDPTGFYVRIVQDGGEVDRWYTGEFNVRPDYDLDPFDGVARAFQVRFAYYGKGPVVFQVSDPVDGILVTPPTVLHVWRPPTGVVIENPNLKVGGFVESDAGSDAFDLFVLGRHFQTEGFFEPIRRVTSVTRTGVSVGTTPIPLISVRKKSAFRQVTIGPSGFAALISGTRNARLQVRLDSTLTGASFGAVPETPATETSLERDVSATAINVGTGIKLYETLGSAGTSRSQALGSEDVFSELPDESVISLVANGIGGSTTISATLRIVEEF